MIKGPRSTVSVVTETSSHDDFKSPSVSESDIVPAWDVYDKHVRFSIVDSNYPCRSYDISVTLERVSHNHGSNQAVYEK